MKKLSAALVISIALSGCGPTPAPSNTPAEQSSVSSSSSESANKPAIVATKDLCQLLPASEVSTILGYTVTSGESMMPNGPTLTSCKYTSSDTSKGYGITIIANYDNDSQTAQAAYTDAVNFQRQALDVSVVSIVNVSSVGEKASLTSAPMMGTLIAVNKNVWITLSMAGKNEGRDEAIEKVAQKAFEVL